MSIYNLCELIKENTQILRSTISNLAFFFFKINIGRAV